MLEHVRVEFTDTQEGGLSCRGEWDGAFGLAQVLEQVCDYVVQCATAASADSVV